MNATYQRLMDAARTILSKDGVEAISIREVANAAGYSPMALYRHFASKEALIDALMLDGMAAWEAKVAKIQRTNPIEWLDAVIDAYLKFALDDPHRFDAAFLIPAQQARKFPQDFTSGRSPVVELAIQRISEGQRSGLLVGMSPLRMAIMLAGLMQGLVSMHRAGRFSGDQEFRAIYRSALNGCLSTLILKGNQK